MSTANPIPDTSTLKASDVRATFAETSIGRLARDSVVRLRASDGFSHARSMAFVSGLIFVQGVIALVGLASAVGSGGLSRTIVRTLETVVPGAAGLLLSDAVRQAHEAGASHRWLAMALGTLGAVVTGMTLFGQTERGLNRLYGIEEDRPTLVKYGRALALTLSAGVLGVVAFGSIMLGRALTPGRDDAILDGAWTLLRWPVAASLLTVSTVLVFRWAPKRRQPSGGWLTPGAILTVALLIGSTFALDAVLRLSSTFGQTYGPLAGLVALSFWTYAASLSFLFGAAFAAQSEAIRAGVSAPQRPERVSEPRVRTERPVSVVTT